MNKKGISLIVLVITIIVMIIIAGAIILSLNSSNVSGKAQWAKLSSDRANYQAEYATRYAASVSKDDYDPTITLSMLSTEDTDYGSWSIEGKGAAGTIIFTSTKYTTKETFAKAYGIAEADIPSWVHFPTNPS